MNFFFDYMYSVLTLVSLSTATAVDECQLFAASRFVASDVSPSSICQDDGMCSALTDTSCGDAYNGLEFVRPLSRNTDGLYRMPAEMHAVHRSVIQENSIDDFINAPSKQKDAAELIAEWTSMSDNTTGPATAALYFDFSRALIALTDSLSAGNPKRPVYSPEVHRPLLRELQVSVERLNAVLEDESNLDEHEVFLKYVDVEIRGSKFLRNYLWIVDKLLVDCMHSRNPTGCTRALVPFVYSVSHIFDSFEIANRVTVNLLGELKYNYLLSAVQFDPDINGTAPDDVSPWRLSMMSNIFELEHFIEKPILGIPPEGFTVMETAGFDSLETWLDSMVAEFVHHNMQLVTEPRSSAKLMEDFTNFLYHVETEVMGLDGRKGTLPEFITAKLCGNVDIVNWFVTNIPSISGFSVFRGVAGFFKLCPATSSMPIRPRIKYLITNFNAARNRGLVADNIKLHITPGNVLAATLAVFKYIPSYDLRDFHAIEIVMGGGAVDEQIFATDQPIPSDATSSPTRDLWGALQAMVVAEESSDERPQARLRATANSESEQIEDVPATDGDDEIHSGPDDDEGWETVSETSQVSTNSTSNNETSISSTKIMWLEMAFTEFLDPANGVTVRHEDDEALTWYPDLTSRDDPDQLRSIGRLIALGLLGGDPGDSISFIVESRTRAGKRGFRDILFFNSEAIETGFYDVFNYPLFDLMLAPDEFFAFLTILREPDVRDRALGFHRAPSRTVPDTAGDDDNEIGEEDELAMIRDIHVLPHENSDQEIDMGESDDDEDGDGDSEEGGNIVIQLFGDDDDNGDDEDEGIDYDGEEEDGDENDDHEAGWEDMDWEEEADGR